MNSNPGARMSSQIYDYASAVQAADKAPRSGRIGHNTVVSVDRTYGTAAIILHNTAIVKYTKDGSVVLDSGQYRTKTTKTRMNEVLPPYLRVAAQRGNWYVYNRGERTPFYDGMVIPLEGEAPASNPGKFDDPLTEYLYRLTLDGVDTLGDVQDYGWHYAKLANVEFAEVVQAADSGEDEISARKAWPRGKKMLHAIISEDSNGFVYRTMFNSERELDKRWERIEAELAKQDDDREGNGG